MSSLPLALFVKPPVQALDFCPDNGKTGTYGSRLQLTCSWVVCLVSPCRACGMVGESTGNSREDAINASPAIRDLLATGLFSGPKVHLWEGAGAGSIPGRRLYCSPNPGHDLSTIALEACPAPMDPNACQARIKTRNGKPILKGLTYDSAKTRQSPLKH